MNLQPLFETQAKLDERIVEKKGLQGQDLLDKKILALQVELGELANEHRGFKFWSENQEPRTEYTCELCEGRKELSVTTDTGSVGETYEVYDVYEVDAECPLCEGYDIEGNPMLEEYVDCLHFILSIGLELDPEIRTCVVEPHIYDEDSITDQFIELNYQAYLVIKNYEYKEHVTGAWFTLLDLFAGLGKMLGFTWQQIETAYYSKNKINHERQANGY